MAVDLSSMDRNLRIGALAFLFIQQPLIDNDVTVACLHDHPHHEALIDKDVSVVSQTTLGWPLWPL